MNEAKAGHQLSSAELHELQQKKQHPQDGPIVVADGISDVFNVGSILRCCEAIGSSAVYFINTPQVSEKKFLRMSRNAALAVPHYFVSMKKFLAALPDLPPLIALEITSTSTDIFLSKYEQKIGFVVGGERQGISEEVLALCQSAVHLPMTGINSSLNVANALCIALYDWQRRFRY